MHLAIGSYLQDGKYKIEKVLGQGTFGITYKCYHTKLQKYVAIKEFFMRELNGRSADSQVTGLTNASLSYNYGQKFKKEAINLSRLDHPNIVRVIDSFDENGTFYYVMDFLEGENLNEYIKSHDITQDEAVSIILEVSKALIYMHEERHMLHLDLKPGNIMRRNSDGHIFLIDFGLSKLYSDDGQPETSTTIGLGTVGYAPIEQGNNRKSGEFRPTIDVYALGATLFRLLTNETPPAASDLVSDEDVIMNLMTTKGISSSLIDVVVKAMSPSVKKRIQSVQSFKEMLMECTPSAQNVKGIRQMTINDKYRELKLVGNRDEETEFVKKKHNENKLDEKKNNETDRYDKIGFAIANTDAEDTKNNKVVYVTAAIVIVAVLLLVFVFGYRTTKNTKEATEELVDEPAAVVEDTEVTVEEAVYDDFDTLNTYLWGSHDIMVQWLSSIGTLTISNQLTPKGFHGKGEIRADNGWLIIDGYFTIQDAKSITFNGAIEQSFNMIGDGKVGYRRGTYHFKSYYGRRYWRIREKDNPIDNNVADYIDIAF